MNRGVPPTDLNARTGEFTPPGTTCSARAKRSALRPTSDVPGLVIAVRVTGPVSQPPGPRARQARQAGSDSSGGGASAVTARSTASHDGPATSIE